MGRLRPIEVNGALLLPWFGSRALRPPSDAWERLPRIAGRNFIAPCRDFFHAIRMRTISFPLWCGLGVAVLQCLAGLATAELQTFPVPAGPARAWSPEAWRKEGRIIDVHQHIEGTPARFDQAVRILDRAGVGTGLVLGAGAVTHAEGQTSEFQKLKTLADLRFPDRFMHSMLLDYSGWDNPDWSTQAVQQIVEGKRLGAAGLKEFKRLGLFLKDGAGNLIKIDDPKLDPVWEKCGELEMPVSIHVADPKAFWLPFEENNERWKELKDHKSWWFGDPAKHPERMALLAALDRVVTKHPKTTFISVHFANNSEDLDWVERAMDSHPNLYADVAARLPEIGRQAPEKVQRLFLKHQDRILFATDFMVYGKLILGSSGDAERPTDDDAVTFYEKCYRFFETADRDWAHMTPIQGDWTISSIALPPAALRKIYFDNARKLFLKSLPAPTLTASRVAEDFTPNGKCDAAAWKTARPVSLEYQSHNGAPKPELSTAVRALWSDKFLYLAYESPYTTLTTFGSKQADERIGLWDKDVVEAFIGTDAKEHQRYTEFEWAPNGDQLDLTVNLPAKDFGWSSGMESATNTDESNKLWRVEVRIPLASLSKESPAVGTRWRINLFRHDAASHTGLAFQPTLQGSFHAPERFGVLVFGK